LVDRVRTATLRASQVKAPWGQIEFEALRLSWFEWPGSRSCPKNRQVLCSSRFGCLPAGGLSTADPGLAVERSVVAQVPRSQRIVLASTAFDLIEPRPRSSERQRLDIDGNECTRLLRNLLPVRTGNSKFRPPVGKVDCASGQGANRGPSPRRLRAGADARPGRCADRPSRCDSAIPWAKHLARGPMGHCGIIDPRGMLTRFGAGCSEDSRAL
jgi:hypothetical protein